MPKAKGTAERIRKLYESAGRQLGYALEEERKMYVHLKRGNNVLARACMVTAIAYNEQAKSFAQKALDLERAN